MEKTQKDDRRSKIGYGSSYRKGEKTELKNKGQINAILGNQVWLVKPDKEAENANPCIWMQAGLIEFKNCNNYYDCPTCKYDLGMHKNVEKKKQISWQNAMRNKSALERTCRHSMTNRIPQRICAYNYECATCDFDQLFEETWSGRVQSDPAEMQMIKGFKVPNGYYFHNGHAWARIESGGKIRIGLDDFALKLMGSPEALNLPLMGKELTKDQSGWGIKRASNTADVLAPLNGVILEVNSKMRENPQTMKQEPYGNGWLFMVHTPDVKKAMNQLMNDTATIDWVGNEVGRLEHMIEEVAGPLAADGGYLSDDIFGTLPKLGWQNLTRAFLRT